MSKTWMSFGLFFFFFLPEMTTDWNWTLITVIAKGLNANMLSKNRRMTPWRHSQLHSLSTSALYRPDVEPQPIMAVSQTHLSHFGPEHITVFWTLTETEPLNIKTKCEQHLGCSFEDGEWKPQCEGALPATTRFFTFNNSVYLHQKDTKDK